MQCSLSSKHVPALSACLSNVERAMSAQDVEHIKVTLASMEKRPMGENVMGHAAARMSDPDS